MACNDGSRCVYVPTRATIILSTPSPNHIYLPLAHHSSSHHPSSISTPRPPLFIPPPFVYIYPSPTTLHPTTFHLYLPFTPTIDITAIKGQIKKLFSTVAYRENLNDILRLGGTDGKTFLPWGPLESAGELGNY